MRSVVRNAYSGSTWGSSEIGDEVATASGMVISCAAWATSASKPMTRTQASASQGLGSTPLAWIDTVGGSLILAMAIGPAVRRCGDGSAGIRSENKGGIRPRYTRRPRRLVPQCPRPVEGPLVAACEYRRSATLG